MDAQVTAVLRARGVRVPPATTHGLDLLPATDLTVRAGELVVVAGDPGPAHMLLALALGGRLDGVHGAVSLDGDSTARTLQDRVALVDVPGVTEPEAHVPAHTAVAEELAMAGRPASRAAVGRWLEEYDVARHVTVEQLGAAQRIGLLTSFALLREPAVVVLTLPERLGGLPGEWAGTVRRMRDQGVGVLVSVSHALLAHYPGVPHATIGNAEQEDA